MTTDNDTTTPFFVDLVAGWCSGAAAVIVCQPIDTILTRQQAGQSLIVGSATTVKGLVSEAGLHSLWRGSSAMISAVPFQNALLMAGYGAGKRYNSDNKDNKLSIFVGGCVGGVFQSFLMSPVELVKVHQQVHVGSTAARKVGSEVFTTTIGGLFTSQGGTTIWRGLGATLLRDGMPHGVWFVSYEYAKDYLSQYYITSNENDTSLSSMHDSFTVPILSGAFAATAAWGVGYPFDLIKTRIQADGGRQRSIYGTAQEIMGEPGGLYRGFTLKLVRAIPASMIGFCVYESVKDKMMGAV